MFKKQCDASPENIKIMTPEWKDIAPGYYNDDDFLADHEWPKHGTCSGLDQLPYFQETVRVFKELPTPQMLSDLAVNGGYVSFDKLNQEYNDLALLQCYDNNMLSGIETCWGKNDDGTAGAQIQCPSWMDSTCHTDFDIYVPAAGQCSIPSTDALNVETALCKSGLYTIVPLYLNFLTN